MSETTSQPPASAARATVTGKSAPAADAPLEVIDSAGRKLRLRVLDPCDTLDLIEAGGKNASNEAWMRMALAVCSVSHIDNMPLPLPDNRNRIRDWARKLGNHGMAAVYRAIYGAPTVQTAEEDAGSAEAMSDEVAAAKN